MRNEPESRNVHLVPIRVKHTVRCRNR
jgi:hypothetical protein